jgi:hypothetical protein
LNFQKRGALVLRRGVATTNHRAEKRVLVGEEGGVGDGFGRERSELSREKIER